MGDVHDVNHVPVILTVQVRDESVLEPHKLHTVIRSESQRQDAHTHAHTLTQGNLEPLINLICMFLVCVRKLEYV